jgi:hypothetical protein
VRILRGLRDISAQVFILKEIAAAAQLAMAGEQGAEIWINAFTSEYNRVVKISQGYLP